MWSWSRRRSANHVPGPPATRSGRSGARLVELQLLRLHSPGPPVIQPAPLLLENSRSEPRCAQRFAAAGSRPAPSAPATSRGCADRSQRQGNDFLYVSSGVHPARREHHPGSLVEIMIPGARTPTEAPWNLSSPHCRCGAFETSSSTVQASVPVSSAEQQAGPHCAWTWKLHAIHGAHLAVVLAQPLHHDGGPVAGRPLPHDCIVSDGRPGTQRPRSRAAGPQATNPRFKMETETVRTTG